MSTTINSTLNGKFIIEDIHGNVLAEEHNIITDWGMIRLTNFNKQFSNDYMRCLADNLKRIFVGTSSIPANASDFALKGFIAGKEYDHFNEPSITKTTYSRDPSNDNLIIQFVKGSRLEFKNTTTIQIQELGIGFNYDANTEHSYSGNYVPATSIYAPSVGSFATHPVLPVSTGVYTVPPYVSHSNNIDFSLWSRSTIPAVSVIAGDILIVKYVLTINTNCDKTQTNWTFDSSSSGAVSLPDRKSNVRRKPFYELLPGTGKTVAGSTVTSYGSAPTEYGGRYGQDSGSITTNGNGLLGILPTLEQPFVGRNEIIMYEGINTALYSDFPGIESTAFPAGTALPATLSATFVSATNGPNYITTKLRHSYRTLSASNTIVCQHRFLFNPGEWPTMFNSALVDVKDFSFIRYNADYTQPSIASLYPAAALTPIRLQPDISDRAKAGILTSMVSAYNPYANDSAMYVGIDYTFTYNRIV